MTPAGVSGNAKARGLQTALSPGRLTQVLLELDLGASFFQLLLSVFSISFGQAFFNSLRSTVNQVFGFFQAQTGDFAHDFNDANFVCANVSQEHGEFGLLFSGGSSATSSRSCNSNSGGSSRHTEFFFHFFDQLGQFEHGHCADGVKDFSFVKCHFSELQKFW